MEICVAIGTGILGKIFEYTVAPVGRQMGYLFCYTSNVEKLRSQARDLKHKNEDMQHRVDEARRNGEEIETGVRDWMRGADCMLEEAETFLKDEGHAKARFSCGSSPSLVSRHQLSRKAKKMTDRIVTAIEGAEKFSKISYRPPIESAIGLFKGYQAFETRKNALKGVMEAVRDPNVRMVSIYGMGGIGKTTLAKKVMRQAEEEKLFDEIVMTSVSQTPDINKIQQEIADRLGLRFDQVMSNAGRADQLRNRLKQEKKFLLVLDDIWNKLELLEIGIHFEDDQRGCKILLTSRSRDVVCYDMDVEKSFKLDPLSFDEAKGLFRKVVGDVMERPNFRDLAPQLVEECAGLPIAILTLASALKKKTAPTIDKDENKTESIWRDALRQLKSSNPVNIEGMSTEVFTSIRWSFDALESEEAKSLLLLCSLHREDENIRIEDLMQYSAGWGLFEDVVTLEETRDRVNSLVESLISRCLLLDGDVHEAVKMHDIIRDVSIWIAAKERSTYSLSDVSKLLNKQRLKDSKVISILDTNFAELPEKFECPHIELLIMRSRALDSSTRTIPEHFFEETKELKVLVLNKSPPLSSSHFPHNLQSLCLRNSKLEDVGLIGDLKNLKILDLSYTDICQLPEKIGQLNRLQLLDLRGCWSLKVIEPNVLSSLVRLEELYMPWKFNEWEVEGVNNQRRNASLIELNNLRQLTTLYLCVQDIKMFPTETLFGDKLQRYQIHMGENGFFKYYEDSRTSLLLSGCERSQLIGFQALMSKSERISLIGLSKGKNNVVYDLDKDGFPQLKRLELSHCDEVQYVVDALEQKSTVHTCSPAFLSLEELHLYRLKNLEMICHGKLIADSFSQLREVDVSSCGRLKNLFPLSIARRLHRIKVSDCETMEEIVVHDEREYEVVFDELRYLSLFSLPKFVQFMCWSQLGVTTASSSAESSSHALFGEKVALSKLESLLLSEINVKKLWADQLLSTSNHMQNLGELNVEKCNELEYISSVDVAKSLVKLQKVMIKECRSLEVIILVTKKQGGEEDGTSLSEKLLLPQLRSLQLANLPNLKTLCGIVHKENAQLGEQQPLFNGMIDFSGLDRLVLNGLNIESLWPDFDHKPLATTSYMENLTSLTVSKCNKLKYLLSFAMAERLVKLRSLEVSDCSEMEDVVAARKKLASREEYPPTSEQILFPKLERIWLSKLGGLKSLCGGADHRIQLKTFVVKQGEDATKPFFDENVAIPNLEYVATDWKEWINAIFGRSQSPVIVPSRNLKELYVKCTSQDEPISLSIFEILHRHQNLERLYVSGCFVNIGTCQRDGHHEGTLAHIQRSSLARPPLMSFHNLTELNVSECHGLTYLLDSSTARSLTQLRVMSIRSCREMKDIIRDCKEGETTEDDAFDFDFKRLEVLALRDLPTLKSFYSGNNAMMFPRLQKLFVSQCPEMKSFSCGVVTTLMLRTVITEIEVEWLWNYTYCMEDRAIPKRECWNGDVDTTIRKLWEESSNSSSQQSFAVTDVEDCFGIGTSIEGAGV